MSCCEYRLSIRGQLHFPGQAREVRDVLFSQIDVELARWTAVQERELPVVNRLVRELGVEVIKVKEE